MSQQPEEIKARGNAAFASGDFEEAVRAYSEAIEQDPTQHVLYSNRAAARLKVGQNDEALSDAAECVRLKPDWMKGYHRKACAQKSCGDLTGSFQTYCAAVEACKADPWLEREKRKAAQEMWVAHHTEPVASIDSFVTIFLLAEGTWDRLACLAYFWNASTPEQRQIIFHKFLVILAGPSGPPPDLDEYQVEQMVALPVTNYEAAGKLPVAPWMEFYEGLSSADKLALYEKLWLATSDTEKKVIYTDLQHFFLKPVLDRRQQLNPATDEVDPEEDEAAALPPADEEGGAAASEGAEEAPATSS